MCLDKVRGRGPSFKRACCGKENELSRDSSRSLRKHKHKKYLQEEVEKIITKKHEDARLEALSQLNANQISGIKEDLQLMRDTLGRLIPEDPPHSHLEQQHQVQARLEQELHTQKTVQARLEAANAQLALTNAQLQLAATQHGEMAQSLKKELT